MFQSGEVVSSNLMVPKKLIEVTSGVFAIDLAAEGVSNFFHSII